MKKSIRRGVFETNSSSTHSLTLCSQEDYDKWENGELLFNEWEKTFVKKEDIKDDESLDDYKTHEEYFDDDYLETFARSYVTKTGEKVYAFGKYGYDG